MLPWNTFHLLITIARHTTLLAASSAYENERSASSILESEKGEIWATVESQKNPMF
jgi:hypothetical protein